MPALRVRDLSVLLHVCWPIRFSNYDDVMREFKDKNQRIQSFYKQIPQSEEGDGRW